jgi:amino acid transporter
VLFAYHGWGNLAPVAEEVREPNRNLPLALIAGVGLVLVLYVGANIAYNLVMSQAEMAGIGDRMVATEFSLRLLGPLGAAAASAAVMISTFGALNGNLIAGPRLLYAMGQDGMLPRVFGTVHPRWHTPALAIGVVGAWSALLVLTEAALARSGALDQVKDPFDRLTDFAMFGSVTFETMGVLSIFVFRWKLPDVERPYRCWGYPLVPALYAVLPLMVLGNMFVAQSFEVRAGLAFVGIGVLLYLGFGLGKVRKS